jgi:hypothetical protein
LTKLAAAQIYRGDAQFRHHLVMHVSVSNQ